LANAGLADDFANLFQSSMSVFLFMTMPVIMFMRVMMLVAVIVV